MNIKDIFKTDFFIINDFVGEDICNDLNSWCLENYKKDFFNDANMGIPNTRLTTRYSDADSFSFPDAAYAVQNKIIKDLKIKNFLLPKFKDGIVCGIGFKGGDIFSHKDPVYFDNTITVHCNILTKKSKYGGDTFINGVKADVKQGDLLCFKVSEDEHWVDRIDGDEQRILWVFGFCIPKDTIM